MLPIFWVVRVCISRVCCWGHLSSYIYISIYINSSLYHVFKFSLSPFSSQTHAASRRFRFSRDTLHRRTGSDARLSLPRFQKIASLPRTRFSRDTLHRRTGSDARLSLRLVSNTSGGTPPLSQEEHVHHDVHTPSHSHRRDLTGRRVTEGDSQTHQGHHR